VHGHVRRTAQHGSLNLDREHTLSGELIEGDVATNVTLRFDVHQFARHPE
jgi:hypothetical protein